MTQRQRKNGIYIMLNDEELKIFKEKMRLSNSKSMAHFIRKCVLEKDIYVVDLEPFRKLQWSLSNATNNINQIAKATNTTGVIYKSDINYIRKTIEKLAKEILNIHSLLLKRTSENNGNN